MRALDGTTNAVHSSRPGERILVHLAHNFHTAGGNRSSTVLNPGYRAHLNPMGRLFS